jgi:hypothetical protein
VYGDGSSYRGTILVTARRPYFSCVNIIVTGKFRTKVLSVTSMYIKPEQTLLKHAIILVEHPIYMAHVASGTGSI